MKILITGAGGLVGRALVQHCLSSGDEVLSYDHKTLDITNAAAVDSEIALQRPEAVINCAAWTDVDGCESNLEKAQSENSFGPENLARASRKADALLITISTDYVFDGTKEGFYTQKDEPRPISVYGRSKLEGEQRAREAYDRTIVVRTGYIFGPGGRNFLSNVVAWAERGQKLKAIRDYWGTPTYSPDLAIKLRELASLDLPEIYHVINSGEGASFEIFAIEALKMAGLSTELLEGVDGDSLGRPAPRPHNSRLKCLISERVGLSPLPHWRDGLADFIRRK